MRKPRKETVAAHLVNLAWNGLSHLEAKPDLLTRRGPLSRAGGRRTAWPHGTLSLVVLRR